MNRYEEIKSLLEASRRALTNRIDEQNNIGIKKAYNLLKEQDEQRIEPEYETASSNEDENEDIVKKTEKKRS